MKTLVLHQDYNVRASYYNDWLDAFTESSVFDCTTFNICNTTSVQEIGKQITEYDVIILLHSCLADNLIYIEPLKAVLNNRRGILLSFIGNEFNSPFCPLSERIALLKDLEVDIVLTQLLQETGEWLYKELGCPVLSLTHALNPLAYQPGPPIEQRKIDIGVRTFKYPIFLGNNDRNKMVHFFEAHGKTHNLTMDLSFSERLGRESWADFLKSTKATVSTEAGGEYLAHSDQFVIDIMRYLEKRSAKKTININQSIFRRFYHKLPYRWKELLLDILKKSPFAVGQIEDYEIYFDEVFEHFFKDKPKSPFYVPSISSRHFDAIGTKTMQIMFEGRYNDILISDKHFLKINRDFSNVQDILEKLKDPRFCQEMLDETYEYVRQSHTHAHRIHSLENFISKVL